MLNDTIAHMRQWMRANGGGTPQSCRAYRARFPQFALDIDERLGAWPSSEPLMAMFQGTGP
jgi:hypothetical protein